MLRYLNPEQLHAALAMPQAIEAMRAVFEAAGQDLAMAPERTVLRQTLAAGRESLLLTMPAGWSGRAYGAKVSSFIADNPAHGHPAVQGVAVLLSPEDGSPRLITDAAALTSLRTAAMVGLATRHLARRDARVLGIIGTGALAADMVRAVASVRPIERVLAHNRTPARIDALASELDLPVQAPGDPESVARGADVLVLSTSSTRPVVADVAIEPGMHINAVGNFSPTGGELGPAAVARCGIWVDSYAGALGEAGEILIAQKQGLLPAGRDAIQGDLAELVSGAAPGRDSPAQITLFKSVGTALADLGALQAAHEVAVERGLGTVLS